MGCWVVGYNGAMNPKVIVAAVLVTLVVAGSSFAQSAEYARAHGGELRIVTKNATNRFSGSLGVLASSTQFGSGRGIEATAGGSLVDDRLWFFGSFQQNAMPVISQLALPAATETRALDAKITANLGDRNSLIGTYASTTATTPTLSPLAIPSSFLSLNYTGIVSDSAFFTATIRRTSTDR